MATVVKTSASVYFVANVGVQDKHNVCKANDSRMLVACFKRTPAFVVRFETHVERFL